MTGKLILRVPKAMKRRHNISVSSSDMISDFGKKVMSSSMH